MTVFGHTSEIVFLLNYKHLSEQIEAGVQTGKLTHYTTRWAWLSEQIKAGVQTGASVHYTKVGRVKYYNVKPEDLTRYFVVS